MDSSDAKAKDRPAGADDEADDAKPRRGDADRPLRPGRRRALRNAGRAEADAEDAVLAEDDADGEEGRPAARGGGQGGPRKGQGQGQGPQAGKGPGGGRGPGGGGQGQGQGRAKGGGLPAAREPGKGGAPARRQGPGGQVARQGGGKGSQVGRRRAQGGPPGRRGAPSIVIDLPSSDGARRARRRGLIRTFALWLSFLLMVVAPSGLAGWYLWTKAADQYASEVSFAVRSLDSAMPSPVMEMFGSVADSTTGDSQMLFEYLQSQPLVEIIDGKVDLEEVYNHPDADPVFALGRDRTIEEKVWYWNLANTVSYDSSSGIIYVEIRAFDPDDAQRVAEAVRQESERLINDLSTNARNDAVEFALVDLREAEARVREARRTLQEFRMTERSVDVTQNIAQAMALISQLKGQRAALQAEYDSRAKMLGGESPALSALRIQIDSLDAQIAAEESRIATKAPEAGGGAPAERRDPKPGVVSESLTSAAGAQEELMVELGFAENMYTSALAAVESARAEARRAQRYLATHISPTRSEEAAYPDRLMWTVAITFLSLLFWSITMLIVSSIRDRN